MTVHAFVDESARPPLPILEREAQRLIIDSRNDCSNPRNDCDKHDERTLRLVLGSHPSTTQLVYEHVDSTYEPLLWVADAVAWCHGAGSDWRRRIDPITAAVISLD